MKPPIVADSSALISLSVIGDQNYVLARNISQQIQQTGRQLIVPGEVVTEIVNVLGKKAGHHQALSVGSFILQSPEYILADTSRTIRDSAFALFSQVGNSVSFTDCLVMAFADHYGTKAIFGFDEAFKKSGYLRIGLDDGTK